MTSFQSDAHEKRRDRSIQILASERAKEGGRKTAESLTRSVRPSVGKENGAGDSATEI